MTAHAFVADLRRRGVHLEAHGDWLRVDAPKGVISDADKDELRRHKTDLLAHLKRPQASPPNISPDETRRHPTQPPIWNAADWRTFYDERAGIAEFDGNQPRHQAEALAYQTTIIEWMNITPPTDLSEDRCAGCGEALGEIGSAAVPVLAGGGAHAWVHHGACHKRFQAARKAEAIKALEAMGISAPGDGNG